MSGKRWWRLVAAAGLLAGSAQAAGLPRPDEVKLCVARADRDLLAGVWDGGGHACSELFALERAEVADISRSGNTADVMATLHYRVVGTAAGPLPSTVQICTGVMVTGSAPAGTTLVRKDRRIAMQEWASGWRCKD